MKKKQQFMFNGSIVLALGKKANIVRMEENNIDGVDYVYGIYCKVEGEKSTGKYHPNDIKELIV